MTMKGQRTRRGIVERAAPVFNTKGYFGASINDLVLATGLGKGGIYNHFSGKEELALEAFDYAAGIMRERFRQALEDKDTALEKLFAVVDVLGALAGDPPLKEKAAEAMESWLRLVGRVVRDGVESGELRPATDPRSVASVVVAALEGAVMLTRLHGEPAHMRRTVEHLKEYLGSLAREDA